MTVEYPSNEQWIRRANKMKLITRSLGRGKTLTEVTPPEAPNAELFDQIIQGECDLDEFEKSQIIERLARTEFEESHVASDHYEISIRAAGNVLKHILTMPSAKQLVEYRRSAVRSIEQRSFSETTVNLKASDDLYNSLVKETAGYADGTEIPVVHKSAVINELLSLINEETGGTDTEGF